MNEKKANSTDKVVITTNKSKNNDSKLVSNILTKTARVMNYGDELLYEDREPGFILDESKR